MIVWGITFCDLYTVEHLSFNCNVVFINDVFHVYPVWVSFSFKSILLIHVRIIQIVYFSFVVEIIGITIYKIIWPIFPLLRNFEAQIVQLTVLLKYTRVPCVFRYHCCQSVQ